MSERKLTDEACKKVIRTLAAKHKIKAALITTRLMCEDDKNDMRDGRVPVDSLDLHVELWIKAGLPDYAHGKSIPLAEEEQVGII